MPATSDRKWWLPGSVVTVVLGLWMTRDAWGPRPPAGDDVMAHLTRADFGLSHLAAHGRLDGWFPRFMLGHQEFLFYGQGFTWLLGLVRLGTFGLLSTTGAMKVASIGSFVLFGPAVVFLARSLGLPKLAAAVAGVLALAVNNVYGVGLAAIFVIGLVPQQVAAAGACIAIGSGLRALTDDRPHGAWLWPGLFAVSMAAVAITHVITVFLVAFFGGLCIVALLLTRRPPARAWVRLVVASGAAVGLAAFWAVPFLAHRNLHGPVTTWATPPIGRRVSDILAGRILFGPGVGWLAVGGFAVAVVLLIRREPFAVAFLLAPPLFLVFSHNAVNWWPSNEIAVQLANRGLGYAGLFALFPVAIGIAEVVRRLPIWLRLPAAPALGAALALAAAMFVVLVLPGRGHSGVEQARQQAAVVPQMQQAAAELARVVPAGARFATERRFPEEIDDTGISHPDLWLARESGRDTLNVFNVESSSVHDVVFTPESISSQPADATADQLAPLGVTHVVTVYPPTATMLAASSRFTLLWESPPLAVLALRPTGGRPPPSSLLSTDGSADATLRTARAERIDIATSAGAPTKATAAVAWSPKWHLHVDGRDAPLSHNAHGLLSFAVPAGQHRVVLTYRSDAADELGALISFMTLAAGALFVWGVWAYSPRRRSGSSSSRMSRRRSRTA